MGIPPKKAAVYIEMFKAINAGVLAAQEPRSRQNFTPEYPLPMAARTHPTLAFQALNRQLGKSREGDVNMVSTSSNALATAC